MELGAALSERTAYRPGVVAGRYELTSLLHEDRHGRVYLAEDLSVRGRLGSLAVRFAVKVYSPEWTGTGDGWACLSSSLRRRCGAAHPHRVTFYDVIDTADEKALVSEYVSGGSVADLLASGGAGEDEVVRIVSDCLAALRSYEASGAACLRLRPATILVTAAGGAKLLDYGCDQSPVAVVRRALRLFGSPFAAPEVRAGHPGDVRADLYSLGVIAAALLGPKSSPAGSLRVWRAPKELDGALGAFVRAATAGKVSQRPATVDDAIEILASSPRRRVSPCRPAATVPSGRPVVGAARPRRVGTTPTRWHGGPRRADVTGGGAVAGTYEREARVFCAAVTAYVCWLLVLIAAAAGTVT